MKKIILISAGLILMNLTFSTCGNQANKETSTEQITVAASYECPMKCENKKFDKPGSCPICGMDLVKVEK
ncbi:MAG: hypothetical protein HY738_11425 [Bacteroidia bacterium]|nr:hypothetical protein [Bacteroidia bacterium]